MIDTQRRKWMHLRRVISRLMSAHAILRYDTIFLITPTCTYSDFARSKFALIENFSSSYMIYACKPGRATCIVGTSYIRLYAIDCLGYPPMWWLQFHTVEPEILLVNFGGASYYRDVLHGRMSTSQHPSEICRWTLTSQQVNRARSPG